MYSILRQATFGGLALFIVITACQHSEKPETVLSKYLDATLHGNPEEAYQYISSQDKKVKSKEEYISERQRKESPLINIFVNKITYEIKEIKKTQNKANIKVTATIPDLGKMIGDFLGAAFLSALGEKEGENELEKLLAEKYKDKGIPMKTTTKEYELIKEMDGWKVFIDWEALEREEEKQKKIENLLEEAERLEKRNKLYSALEKYNQILTFDRENVEAKRAKHKLRTKIDKFEEKKTYIEQVELKNVHVDEGRRFGLGDPEKSIFGTIINKGDRTLTKVQITVYFLDEKGNTIGEKDFHPILVTEFSLSDDKPFKPNYVKDFGYIIEDDAPSMWGGDVKVKITDIGFE